MKPYALKAWYSQHHKAPKSWSILEFIQESMMLEGKPHRAVYCGNIVDCRYNWCHLHQPHHHPFSIEKILDCFKSKLLVSRHWWKKRCRWDDWILHNFYSKFYFWKPPDYNWHLQKHILLEDRKITLCFFNSIIPIKRWLCIFTWIESRPLKVQSYITRYIDVSLNSCPGEEIKDFFGIGIFWDSRFWTDWAWKQSAAELQNAKCLFSFFLDDRKRICWNRVLPIK